MRFVFSKLALVNECEYYVQVLRVECLVNRYAALDKSINIDKGTPECMYVSIYVSKT